MRLKPLLCTPLDSMPTSTSPVLDEARPPELVALRQADGEAGHVEVAAGELPGVLGGLAAEQHALGAQAALVHAGDDLGDLFGHDLADHEVVEEEQRHGAAGRHVVDAHRHEVDADGAQLVHGAGQLDLGAHAVGAGHQHRVLELRQPHRSAEAAQPAEHQRVLRALEPLLHEVDGAVARLDVDARVFVGEALSSAMLAPRRASPAASLRRDVLPCGQRARSRGQRRANALRCHPESEATALACREPGRGDARVVRACSFTTAAKSRSSKERVRTMPWRRSPHPR